MGNNESHHCVQIQELRRHFKNNDLECAKELFETHPHDNNWNSFFKEALNVRETNLEMFKMMKEIMKSRNITLNSNDPSFFNSCLTNNNISIEIIQFLIERKLDVKKIDHPLHLVVSKKGNQKKNLIFFYFLFNL